MKLLFCGISSDDGRFNRILKTEGTAPFAQQKLERLMLSGLAQFLPCDQVEMVSLSPVQRYPVCPDWRKKRETDKLEGFLVRYIGFINLPVLKQLTTCASFLFETLSWAKKYRGEEKAILLYGTNPLQVLPLFIVRRLFNVKLVSYVSEIDSFRFLSDGSLAQRIKNKIFVKSSAWFADAFDGYVLISKHMTEQINKHNRPYTVIEGMVDSRQEYLPRETKKNILYAGSLHKKYGVSKLIEAFLGLDQSEYQLVVYGDGDFVPDLKDLCRENPSICYRGIAANEIILQEEREAALLVNPRPSEDLYTKYSFPSKTFEYMLSGTPCLITKLSGIPDVYFAYCYSFSDETVDGMKTALQEVLALSDSEREEMGLKAYSYVKREKNNCVQMKKVWDFIWEEVCNDCL